VGGRSTVSALVDALGDAQERLAATLDGLTDEEVTLPSYDDGWSIADVASHLGSGAEIFTGHLRSGVKGEPAAPPGAARPVWETWNAKQPAEQVRDAVAANAAFLEQAGRLTDDERTRWRLHLFGLDLDLAAFLRMRLSEQVVHTWDVAVALDPAATLPPGAAAYVLENLAPVAAWASRPHDEQVSVEVRTTDPERAFHLDLGPGGVSLTPSYDDTDAAAELTLPAESLVRLVYGRLDVDHTPEHSQSGTRGLADLRAVFPGV
jgi:uncharacterized protein (TIGR03083 family)